MHWNISISVSKSQQSVSGRDERRHRIQFFVEQNVQGVFVKCKQQRQANLQSKDLNTCGSGFSLPTMKHDFSWLSVLKIVSTKMTVVKTLGLVISTSSSKFCSLEKNLISKETRRKNSSIPSARLCQWISLSCLSTKLKEQHYHVTWVKQIYIYSTKK